MIDYKKSLALTIARQCLFTDSKDIYCEDFKLYFDKELEFEFSVIFTTLDMGEGNVEKYLNLEIWFFDYYDEVGDCGHSVLLNKEHYFLGKTIDGDVDNLQFGYINDDEVYDCIMAFLDEFETKYSLNEPQSA